ncbi:Uu.00g004650.m01.CDS01 [Anthostomella pinea]|uniref:Uu.00g004650.m01.CDS01 n=1 Tax=Anthostomella pinea TaxID=933095 RepID=A0AAI8VJZ2_9PEZI|nr:Uu.00g004650.m01.CDS01 [Anthostomella pinea]
MPDWRDDYLTSLQDAERNNPVNKDLVEACSQLADRVAALEAEKAVLQGSPTSKPTKTTPTATTTTTTTTTVAAAAAAAAAATATPTPTPTATTGTTTAPASDPATIAQLRLDLAEALRARGQLQNMLRAADEELRRLRARTKADGKRVADLAAERNSILARLKDRSEELAGKNKLLKDVQDDNLTLNIQLDVTEQKVAKVQAENKELVDRWMKRMGHEADAMNRQNESPHKHTR